MFQHSSDDIPSKSSGFRISQKFPRVTFLRFLEEKIARYLDSKIKEEKQPLLHPVRNQKPSPKSAPSKKNAF